MVEAIGITKQHFLSVLEKHKSKGDEIRVASNKRYYEDIRKEIVSAPGRIAQ